jgi:DnaK suppressor protein
MEKKKLKTYRERLLQERDALLGVVGRNEDYGREADTEATQDPADKASNSYTKELLFSQSTNDRIILTQIGEALERMEQEEYGSCANCGQEIQPKRLDAVPWTRYCIKCQELMEKGLLNENE